jgi:hypothetical protein
MDSFNEDEDFLPEFNTKSNKFDGSDRIDFESLMELFEDINTNPLFNQTNELKSKIDHKMEESKLQQTRELLKNKRKYDDCLLNNSDDDSLSIKSNTSHKKTNKQSALRYRLKKLNEKDRLYEAREYLEKQNADIKREIYYTEKEIDQLKTLIVQMLMFKGIMSPTGKIINT